MNTIGIACIWILSLSAAYFVGEARGWNRGYKDGCELAELYRDFYYNAIDVLADVARDERKPEDEADWWKAGERPPWERE